MHFTSNEGITQLPAKATVDLAGKLLINSQLEGFRQLSYEHIVGEKSYKHDNEIYTKFQKLIVGCLDKADVPTCECCGCKMHAHGQYETVIRHLPFGDSYYSVKLIRDRYRCPKCKRTCSHEAPFKDGDHNISKALINSVEDQLRIGIRLKDIVQNTGLHEHTVKDIDKSRLQDKHTELIPEGRKLKRPTTYSKYIGIDEFKLHNSHQYATVFIDLITGHILFFDYTKGKMVVDNFIKFVGLEWMSHVEAVACDMNADFARAFTKACPHLDIVYDHFHIIKNFNEKVIMPVCIAEQKRLLEQGDKKAAATLKHSKYVLIANKATRLAKDEEAKQPPKEKADKIFKKPVKKPKGNVEEYYQKLIKENDLFLKIDFIKEHLYAAYKGTDNFSMSEHIDAVIDICEKSGEKHFEWFGRLLTSHYKGITSYARHHISSGKVEGTNNLIKSIRRTGYGYPDDDYFFLKVYDQSRRK